MNPYYSDDLVTLWCGDSLENPSWWLSADVMVTDPPYGMSYRSGWNDGASVESDDSLQARDTALRLWGDRPALVFGRWSVEKPVGTRATLTWEKGNHTGMGDLRLPWKPNTEEVYVLGHGFIGPRTSSVIRCMAPPPAEWQGRMHPTQKPQALMEELISKCPPGVVCDPFAGSGSTLVAAKAQGRTCVGVELEERYCEAAAKRLAQGVLDFG